MYKNKEIKTKNTHLDGPNSETLGTFSKDKTDSIHQIRLPYEHRWSYFVMKAKISNKN